MIDPVEAVVQFLRRDADLNVLVAGQVAGKHRYGDGWEIPSKGIALRANGGPVDLYTERQLQRLDARMYGETQPEAMRVYRRVIALMRDATRVKVETENGNALIYWLVPRSAPSLLYDQDLKMDYVLVFVEAAVSEIDVP